MPIPEPRRPGSHRDDPDPFRAVTIAFVAWWIVCAIVGLGFLGLIAWAIIRLVAWVVTL